MDFGQFWGGGGAALYEIEQSLRFDGSAYLSRSPSGTGSTYAGQRYTVSMWVKYALVSSEAGLFNATQSGEFYNSYYIRPNGAGFQSVKNSGMRPFFEGTEPFRDPSAWYHIVVVQDTPNSNSSLRDRFFVNNRELTQFPTWQNESSQNQSLPWFGSTVTHYVGSHYHSQSPFKGYIAEFHACDGYVYSPTDFGEYNDSGVWVPKGVSGLNYGTNGFYLKFDPSATNGIGHDHSGNGNNFTPTGFSTSGTGTDVMDDTPTTNYCTLNPLDKNSNMTFNNGNLDTVGTNGIGTATFGLSSGKWYWEATLTNPWYSSAFGLYYFGEHGLSKGGSSGSYDMGAKLYATQYGPAGGTYSNGSRVTAYTSYATNDIIGFAFDADAMQLDIYRNNTKIGSTLSVPAGNIYPTVYNEGTGGDPGGSTYNFGQRAFAYTPPTGYKALNTDNLSAPNIADGTQYFNTVLYTGTSASTQAITGVGFQPDHTWIKNRSSASDHLLFDAVRGVTKVLKTVGTGGEETDANAFQSFNSDGFTLGTSTNGNPTKTNGEAYVAWNWLAANGTQTLTAGSINSTVSANPTAGFSIVSYTGNATSGATVAHGLGVAPSFITVKTRSGTDNWLTYHKSAGADRSTMLNNSDSSIVRSSYWNNTAPTSSVFTLGNSSEGNTNGATQIAYCFAEVEGYSKFGSYTGNGSLDGPFVYCGFRPSWVMIKRTDSSGEWFMVDTSRNPYNSADDDLFANYNFAETSSSGKDLLSNGFKIRESGASMNGSGGSFIFIAFAENPFGGDGVSPAAAR